MESILDCSVYFIGIWKESSETGINKQNYLVWYIKVPFKNVKFEPLDWHLNYKFFHPQLGSIIGHHSEVG